MADPAMIQAQIEEFRASAPREIFDEIVALYLSDSQDRIADIRKAFGCRNLDTLANAAHGLKGSSLSLGLASVTEAAAALEHAARHGAESDLGTLVDDVERCYSMTAEVLDKL